MTTRQHIVAASLMATTAIAAQTMPAASGEMIYASFAGPRHAVNEKALPPWFAAVKEATDGDVAWKLVAGGQLMNGRETVESVGNGIADAGFVVPSYTPSALPGIATIYSTLVFGDDVVAAGGAAIETLLFDCPQCIDDLKEQNAVAIAGYSATPFYVMCNEPVTSLEELKGKKVRVSGSGAPLMETAGATPVAMSPADGTTAMQRGTIDCVLGSVNWLQSYGYQDVVTDIVDHPMGMMGPVLTGYINRDSWDALTDEQKQAHIDAAPELTARGVLDAYYAADQEALAALEDNGIEMHEGDDALDGMIEEYRKEARAKTIEEMKGLGLDDPEAIIDAYEENLEKWREISPDIGHDVGKFAEALKREVYDKLDPAKL